MSGSTQSPWSTPSKSEYQFGEGFIQLKDDGEFQKFDQGLVDEILERELPDGQASSEDHLDSFSENSDQRRSSWSKAPKVKVKDAAPPPRQLNKYKVSHSPTKLKNGKVMPVPILKARSQSLDHRSKKTPGGKSKGKLPYGSQTNLNRKSPNLEESSEASSENSRVPTVVCSGSSERKSPPSCDRKSQGQQPSQSSKDSPKKSPRKSRKKARDIIELVDPFNQIRSDDVRRWEKEIRTTAKIDVEASDLAASLAFTNAFVLKLNQIAKQGLLNRNVVFRVGAYISKYRIEDADWKKSLNSFFSFARQLASVREGLGTLEQKETFDLEDRVPPRPATAKPKDPDFYDFKDDNLAKDYRKLWEEYHALKTASTDQ
ncbi:hypothetical protein TCAL_12111, partial [Tigriopus californicus]|eukprot:TCALIF_12111-PA protein Name:"Protein of unknown function" AED:0.37 eAED:0.37 QI:1/0.33/0/0.5/0.66/0.75/4/0/372